MNRPFMVPTQYQNVANSLPGVMDRSGVAYGGGQNRDMAGSWQAGLDDLHQRFRTTRGDGSWGGYNVPSEHNPVQDMIGVYGQGTKQLPDRSARATTLSLGRLSGSLMREAREVLPRRVGNPFGPGVDSRAFGSGNQGIHGNVHARIRDLQGLGALPYTSTFGVRGLGAVDAPPWYENPLYLGAGAVAIIGGVWFLTRKKR